MLKKARQAASGARKQSVAGVAQAAAGARKKSSVGAQSGDTPAAPAAANLRKSLSKLSLAAE